MKFWERAEVCERPGHSEGPLRTRASKSLLLVFLQFVVLPLFQVLDKALVLVLLLHLFSINPSQLIIAVRYAELVQLPLLLLLVPQIAAAQALNPPWNESSSGQMSDSVQKPILCHGFPHAQQLVGFGLLVVGNEHEPFRHLLNLE